jgi:hypothetical protein
MRTQPFTLRLSLKIHTTPMEPLMRTVIVLACNSIAKGNALAHTINQETRGGVGHRISDLGRRHWPLSLPRCRTKALEILGLNEFDTYLDREWLYQFFNRHTRGKALIENLYEASRVCALFRAQLVGPRILWYARTHRHLPFSSNPSHNSEYACHEKAVAGDV